jgi:hypothetical protein
MTNWVIAKHQVGIAGRVTDGVTGKPLSGIRVMISAMPPLFKRRLDIVALQYRNDWEMMQERADRTLTRRDGLFYFLDLPDGHYGVTASVSRPGMRYGVAEQNVQVARDKKGAVTFINMTLQPTVVKGKITGPGHKTSIAMAEARIQGSGERTFSNAQGEYLLAAIEPGKRTVQVFAQGFRSASQAVTIEGPGQAHTLNFALLKEGG